MKRGQIELPQGMLRNFRGVVISSTFRSSVADVVLGARGNAVRRVQSLTLVAPYVCGGHRGTQKGILARTFSHAAPTGVARDVDHGRECPPDATCRTFDSRHARRSLHQL